MIYIKSILAGFAALIVCAVAVPIVVILVVHLKAIASHTDGFIGEWYVSGPRSPTGWVIAILIFAAGFFLEFRHARSK